MGANEIRLGNYVFHCKQVLCMDYNAMHDTYIDNDFDELEPIQLTEDWVLKFGFEEVKGSDCDFKLQIQKNIGGGNPEFDIWVDFGEEDGDGRLPMSIQIVSQDSEWLRTKVKHVHELQNLYFSLTGEELEITSQRTTTDQTSYENRGI
jgi:hypothetical protein